MSMDMLLERARKGDLRATGRLLTLLEGIDSLEALLLLEKITPLTGHAHVIGFTGIPGAGKSTLISAVIGEYRKRGYKVAVIAVDPSSPISSGSLMGDRLRMQAHSVDPGVFIRSLPTRGLKGGISLAGLALMEAFDALGFDKIIVETVGVGQSEVDVMEAVHTLLVVTMPGAGDDIQTLKAGVMEIGDVYVLNKSDKPEASQTWEYLRFSLESGELGRGGGWTPKIVRTSAVMGSGISKLVDVIEEHKKFLMDSGLFGKRLLGRRRLLIKLLASHLANLAVRRSLARTSDAIEFLDKGRYVEVLEKVLQGAINELRYIIEGGRGV